MDLSNVKYIQFKNKDGTFKKFMVTHYYGYYGTEKKPTNTFIDDGKFFVSAWDEDILEQISELDINDRHDEYGPCGISHCAIYRYA